MKAENRNLVLLVLVYAFLGSALLTLVPYPALKENDLGYYSLCTFTPWSTIFLAMVGGFFWAMRSYSMSRKF